MYIVYGRVLLYKGSFTCYFVNYLYRNGIYRIILGTNFYFKVNIIYLTCGDVFTIDRPAHTGSHIQSDGNIGIGTISPSYKLDVAGTLRAREIIVNTTGADFVFADDYQLRPLSEVETFIKVNKHLPEIKSAQEMQENGVSMNELQIQLLQKIEELTLYILQQEKRIRELEQVNK